MANHPLRIEMGTILFTDEDVTVIKDEPDVLICEIDMVSKYAELIQGSLMREGKFVPFVDLFAGPRTLGIDTSTEKPTTIILPPWTVDWHVLADTARYTTRIAAWKCSDDD